MGGRGVDICLHEPRLPFPRRSIEGNLGEIIVGLNIAETIALIKFVQNSQVLGSGSAPLKLIRIPDKGKKVFPVKIFIVPCSV